MTNQSGIDPTLMDPEFLARINPQLIKQYLNNQTPEQLNAINPERRVLLQTLAAQADLDAIIAR
jgi:hypothetical protein